MRFPEPSANPVAVPDDKMAVQVNVVPGVVLDKAIDVVPPEQNDCEAGEGVATGIGFTVTSILAVALQPFPSVIFTE